MRKSHLVIIISVSLFCGFLVGRRSVKPIVMATIESSRAITEVSKCPTDNEELNAGGSENSSTGVSSNLKVSQESLATDSSTTATPSKSKNRSVDIAFESDLKEFLKGSEVPNFFDELKSAKAVGEEQLKVLNGRFAGQVAFDDSQKENWDLDMNINGQVYDGEAKGDKIVSLSKNGKVFARTTGRGRIKGVLTMNSDPSAILIEVNGDEGFIQLYFIPRLDVFSGIYYRKVAVGQFEREGTVKLGRL